MGSSESATHALPWPPKHQGAHVNAEDLDAQAPVPEEVTKEQKLRNMRIDCGDERDEDFGCEDGSSDEDDQGDDGVSPNKEIKHPLHFPKAAAANFVFFHTGLPGFSPPRWS